MERDVVVLTNHFQSVQDTILQFEPVLKDFQHGIQIWNGANEVIFENHIFQSLMRLKHHVEICQKFVQKLISHVMTHETELLNMKLPIFIEPNNYTYWSAFPIVSNHQFRGILIMVKKVPVYLEQSEVELLKTVEPIYYTVHQNDFIAEVDEMIAIKQQLVQMASGNKPIMLSGEYGVGKQCASLMVHYKQIENCTAYLVIDAARMKDDEILVNIHSHAKIIQQSIVDKSFKGTVYIKNIDQLSYSIQKHCVNWICCSKDEVAKHIRFIFSSTNSLQHIFENGFIYPELYEQLVAQHIAIPPLRERLEELPSLVNIWLSKLSVQLKGKRIGIEAEAMNLLARYTWPGNITQLKNMLETIILSMNTDLISKQLILDFLPFSYVTEQQNGVLSLAETEKKMIEKALQKYGRTLDGKKLAADALEISLATLYNKMKVYNL